MVSISLTQLVFSEIHVCLPIGYQYEIWGLSSDMPRIESDVWT